MNRDYFWLFVTLAGLAIAYNSTNWNTKGLISSNDAPSIDPKDVGASPQQIYEIVPDFQQCREGILKASEKQKILNRINFIRKLHELPPVSYQSSYDRQNAKAALMSAVNEEENSKNIPTNQQKCWSAEGEIGLQNSMGYFVFSSDINSTTSLVESEHFIDYLFEDPRSNGLREREFFLNPFLNSISFGRADGSPNYSKTKILTYDEEQIETPVNHVTSVAVQAISEGQIGQNLKQEFIAYPYLNYPYELFQKDEHIRGYPPMSFSAIADRNNPQNNQNIDFSIATIEIRDKKQTLVPVHSIQIEESNIDLGKILSWKVDELERNRLYHVKIHNVKVSDRYLNYTYWFKLK